MYRLSKKFRFETAHRLAKGYKGKCRNIHGHSWNGEIIIECHGLNKFDFGIDFGVLKEFTKTIEDRLDHGIMLFGGDNKLIDLCEEMQMKIIVFGANPTCEVVAKWIFERATGYFSTFNLKDFKIHCVSIEETCTSRCEYYG